jgi:hypothetical protein
MTRLRLSVAFVALVLLGTPWAGVPSLKTTSKFIWAFTFTSISIRHTRVA